ncbi:Zinc finger-homeodomain protein 1 [Zostera marina]|uniref:Zinc finger-homeodomain protein 1 n=1 Tax=Zostera marina TaxID=29655 RepID=A0A0K9NLN4_ZOSMR|nr:Zinc finger-homeodomain protein 1 [Zostera marina]
MDVSIHEEGEDTKYHVGDYPTSNGLPLCITDENNNNNTNNNNNNEEEEEVVEVVATKYRECLKNHAASIGGNATDGCGEFMAGGGEGTMEAFQCSACRCHRNFHRKVVEGENTLDLYHNFKGRNMMVPKGVMISGSADHHLYGGYNSTHNSLMPISSPPHYMIMPLGAMQTSESDDMEGVAVGGMPRPQPLMTKKRYRTKFTSDQKEKMLGFAERAGWKLQKQEENVVQNFCQEIGVKRRVLKVWMHNNKHNLAKKP